MPGDRRRRRAAVTVIAVVALAGGWLAHRRWVVGRAPASVCASIHFGDRNVPEHVFAEIESDAWGMTKTTVIARDGTVREGTERTLLTPDEMKRLEQDIAATGIYDLGGGCFAGWTPDVPTDEGTMHLWLVHDGVAHEYAWLTGHRHPHALDDAIRVLVATRARGPQPRL